jgi:hypothetical protein
VGAPDVRSLAEDGARKLGDGLHFLVCAASSFLKSSVAFFVSS